MLSDFFASISEKIIPAILIVISITLALFLCAYLTNQLTATRQLVRMVEVIGKSETTYVLPQYIDNQPIMIPHQAYKLTFRVGKTEMSGDVNLECYRNAKKGDKMDIYIRKGMFSTDVYPVCK